MAFCQPTVAGILLFHSHDEPGLANWQSGLFYADGAPKAGIAFVRDALARARGGSIARCRELELSPQTTALSFATSRAEVTARLRCDLDCSILARLERLPAGKPVRTRRQWARAGTSATIVVPRRGIPRGRYVLTLELTQPVNPGTPTIVESRPLTLG
jgi:hypothetical protein